jgi:hypothetical protein
VVGRRTRRPGRCPRTLPAGHAELRPPLVLAASEQALRPATRLMMQTVSQVPTQASGRQSMSKRGTQRRLYLPTVFLRSKRLKQSSPHRARLCGRLCRVMWCGRRPAPSRATCREAEKVPAACWPWAAASSDGGCRKRRGSVVAALPLAVVRSAAPCMARQLQAQATPRFASATIVDLLALQYVVRVTVEPSHLALTWHPIWLPRSAT